VKTTPFFEEIAAGSACCNVLSQPSSKIPVSFNIAHPVPGQLEGLEFTNIGRIKMDAGI